MAQPNYITKTGYLKIIAEMKALAGEERPRIVREVADAAAEGDRSENAAYIYGKKRLREIDRRLRYLQQRLKHIQVVTERPDSKAVHFGAIVEVEDEDGRRLKYQIVGVDEVDVKAGRISWQSPVGRALLKKRKGDTVSIILANGERELEIVSIKYEDPD